MSRAFVREPESSADYCPRCGSKGESVGRETIQAHLPEGKPAPLADPANFCPSPRCDVVYFDAFEQILTTGDLNGPVYPKDPDAPICPCFGLTRQDVEQDVREGVVTRVKAILEKAKSPEARCLHKAVNGQPCTAFVQKCYMQCREAANRGQ